MIREWFNSVQRVVAQYSIANKDIFNFNKIGFAMGLIATAKVITYVEYYRKRLML